MGDSIRMSYAQLVEKELAGKAVIIMAKANGGDSNNVLKNLDEWVIRQQPAVVHFNCGIHDTKKFKNHGPLSGPARATTRRTCGRLLPAFAARPRPWGCSPRPLPSSTTGQRQPAARPTTLCWKRASSSTTRSPVKVMQELKVPIDDLHAVFPDAASRSECLPPTESISRPPGNWAWPRPWPPPSLSTCLRADKAAAERGDWLRNRLYLPSSPTHCATQPPADGPGGQPGRAAVPAWPPGLTRYHVSSQEQPAAPGRLVRLEA